MVVIRSTEGTRSRMRGTLSTFLLAVACALWSLPARAQQSVGNFKFAAKVQATKANGTITIDRTVELTLEPAGSTWVVVAYRVTATRTAPTPKPTTTAPRHTTTTTGRRARTHSTTTTTHAKRAP